MPPPSRLTDTGTGHGCFPPTNIISAAGTVTINGLRSARTGDPLAPHACPEVPPHPRAVGMGIAKITVEGSSMAVIGTPVNCGGMLVTGASTVVAG